MEALIPVRVCGREFTEHDLTIIREEVKGAEPPVRAEIARRVCRALGWVDRRGRAKAMSCRLALVRLNQRGLIDLPPPRNGNGNGQPLSRQRPVLPVSQAVSCAVEELDGLELSRVEGRKCSALWNGLIDRYHYLGYRPLPGAQLRYLIRWREGELGAIGFGAGAWAVGPRDRWIGWDARTRAVHLHQVLNNARFLILPWVRSPNLASTVLALCARRVPEDFLRAYGYRPVLLETFVDTERHRGTCYRAANWVALGCTQGRGKLDWGHRHALPVKEIFVYPLVSRFRQALGVGA